MILRSSIFTNKTSRQELFFSLLIVSLILFGTYHFAFSLGAFASCVCAMFFMSNSYYLSLLFLIMPMASIFKLEPNTTSLFTYLELIYVIWHICKKRFMIKIGELLAIFFIFYIIITGGLDASFNITRTIKILVNLMLIGYIAELDPEREHKRLFLYYVAGVIVSSLIRLTDSTLFPIVEYVVEKTESFAGVATVRFSGLYADPNYYSVNVIIAMCLLIILYKRKELNFSTTVWLNALLIIFIGMTGSKSSFLMLVLPILLMVYVCIKNRNRIALCFCLLGLLCIALLVAMGKIQLFDYVLLRLANTGSSVDMFTTGRTAIWRSYMQYLENNPLHLLIGTGSSIFTLDGKAAHNTYIDLIYQFGLVGAGLYLTIVYFSIRKLQRNCQKSFVNASVFISVAVMYVFLSELLYIDLPFHIALSCFVWNLETG